MTLLAGWLAIHVRRPQKDVHSLSSAGLDDQVKTSPNAITENGKDSFWFLFSPSPAAKCGETRRLVAYCHLLLTVDTPHPP